MRKVFEVDVVLSPFEDFTRLKCEITVEATKADGSDVNYVIESLIHEDGTILRQEELNATALAVLDRAAKTIADANAEWAAQEYAEGLIENFGLARIEERDDGA